MAGVESIGYGLSSAAVMLLLLLVFYACHFRALQQGTYQSMERKGGVGKAGKAALLFAAIGYTGYYMVVAVTGDLGGFVMGMAAFSVLLILGLYMAFVFIHRYRFIQNNMDKLKAHYPLLGLPKEQPNAGKGMLARSLPTSLIMRVSPKACAPLRQTFEAGRRMADCIFIGSSQRSLLDFGFFVEVWI